MNKDELFDLFVEYVRWAEETGPTVIEIIEKINADVRLSALEKIHLGLRLGVTFADTMFNPKDN